MPTYILYACPIIFYTVKAACNATVEQADNVVELDPPFSRMIRPGTRTPHLSCAPPRRARALQAFTIHIVHTADDVSAQGLGEGPGARETARAGRMDHPATTSFLTVVRLHAFSYKSMQHLTFEIINANNSKHFLNSTPVPGRDPACDPCMHAGCI